MSFVSTSAPQTIEIGQPHMAPEEATVLQRSLAGVRRYLEFGLGGSTLLAVRAGVETIVAVESDSAWANAVRNHPEIAPRVNDGSAAILHADIGPTGRFGSPTSAASIGRWHNYIRVPWEECERRAMHPELVLVDGRFRVAACLSVIVGVSLLREEGSPPTTVLVHDIVPARKSYSRIFQFFDVIEEVATLRVMRINPHISPVRAFTELLATQFDGL